MTHIIRWLKCITWAQVNLVLWLALLGAVFAGASHNELMVITIFGVILAALAEHTAHRRRGKNIHTAEQA